MLWLNVAGPILLEDYHLIEKLAQVRDVLQAWLLPELCACC